MNIYPNTIIFCIYVMSVWLCVRVRECANARVCGLFLIFTRAISQWNPSHYKHEFVIYFFFRMVANHFVCKFCCFCGFFFLFISVYNVSIVMHEIRIEVWRCDVCASCCALWLRWMMENVHDKNLKVQSARSGFIGNNYSDFNLNNTCLFTAVRFQWTTIELNTAENTQDLWKTKQKSK